MPAEENDDEKEEAMTRLAGVAAVLTTLIIYRVIINVREEQRLLLENVGADPNGIRSPRQTLA
jgi:hypothetical protein